MSGIYFTHFLSWNVSFLMHPSKTDVNHLLNYSA